MKMIQKLLPLLLIACPVTTAYSQPEAESFNHIYSLIQEKNFFEANRSYARDQESLSPAHRSFVESALSNAFNQPEQSAEHIQSLFQHHYNQVPDSLKIQAYQIHEDNFVKLYEYKEAKKTSEALLAQHTPLLTDEEKDDLTNQLKIWTALQDEPKQKVEVEGETKLQLIKDKAGLDNLLATSGTDSLNMIFDTGANLSTTIKSVAEKLNMKILPAEIEVGSITGEKVPAQLAICEKFSLGNINIYNAVFLVFKDEDLAFPQIDYQIYGILGFPVLAALNEIQLTREGFFIVPEEETEFDGASNLALDGFNPLILIEDYHYTFDSGANTTLLYAPYYLAHRQQIDSTYEKSTVQFGGAGGAVELEGFQVDFSFLWDDEHITISNVNLLTDDRAEKKQVYGNIGQDVIRQFDKVTLNFNQMFVAFY